MECVSSSIVRRDSQRSALSSGSRISHRDSQGSFGSTRSVHFDFRETVEIEFNPQDPPNPSTRRDLRSMVQACTSSVQSNMLDVTSKAAGVSMPKASWAGMRELAAYAERSSGFTRRDVKTMVHWVGVSR